MSEDIAGEADASASPLRASASRLLADLLTPQARAQLAGGELPAALWAAIEELGLPSALLPEDAGGFGAPFAEALSLLRVAGEHASPLPLAETMVARWLLARAGLEPPAGPLSLAAGCEIACGTGGRISGRAWAAPWARQVDAIVLLTNAPGGPVVVRLPKDGLTIEAGVNIAGEPRDTVSFDALPTVSAPSPVDLNHLRAMGATTRILMIAGALDAVSAMTTGYARERKQFGRAIGKFQAVQQNLAVLASQAAAAGVAGDIAAEAVAAGGATRMMAVAAAKVRAGEAAGLGAAIAHQVHGAIGFTEEHRLQDFTRRLWAWRDEYGPETEWALRLGRSFATSGPDRLWSALAAV
jgi:alkylation response protein AidB-like acyl-CoA dehydrogenase